MMRRQLLVTLVTVLTAASLACGAKRPVRATPPPPPAPLPPPPPPTVDARPLTGIGLTWPPELAPVPVAELLEEMAALAPPPPPADRERVPDAPVPPPPPPAVDPPRLTTPETPDAAAATRQVQDSLARARRALAALRYDRLTADARAQYDTVVQLMQQAEEALRTRDFAFALKVADKADTLARRLGSQTK